MTIFLTSSFIKYQKPSEYEPAPLMEDNGFTDNLKSYWKGESNFLIFTSDPADYAMTDHLAVEMSDAFRLSGFSVAKMRCYDNRSIDAYMEEHSCSSIMAAEESIKEAVSWADVIFIAGGHAPTENKFMKLCNLADALKNFGGLLITLSAGSVNSASQVYLIPEKEGETLRPDYVKYTSGLGLTNICMIPHIQYLKSVSLDGRDMVKDIVANDSKGREFYLIPDGSYFIIDNGITQFFGMGEVIRDGKIRELSAGIVNTDNKAYRRGGEEGHFEKNRFFDTLMSSGYDLVLEIDDATHRVEFYHVSEFMLSKGVIPVKMKTYDEVTQVVARLLVEDERECALEQLRAGYVRDVIIRDGAYVVTMHIDTGEGLRTENMRIISMPGEPGRMLCFMSDISSVLDHDWMTDVYSRYGFVSEGDKILKKLDPNKEYSVVYSNISGFKAVNDMFGTFHGDMVIFALRDVLNAAFVPVIMARLESDHFILITEKKNLDEANINRVCHRVYVADYIEYQYTIRLGIYHLKDRSVSISTALDGAKLAEASIPDDQGKCYAVFDEKMRMDYLEQRKFIAELDDALAAREFKTYYQPVVDAKTGEIISAEALVRWQHHEKGMIPPGVFVPAFEEGGLISKIDHFMVSNVLRFNKERKDKGLKFVPCAVNLSRVDFYDTRIMDEIMNWLHSSDDIKNMLKLEVTESAYAILENKALEYLNDMKGMGMSLLLDDFGSGMSSMSTLESFDFNIIKLDMGFIRKIGKSKKAEAIIKSVILMSHALGARVVAEGVETEEHLEFLRAADCDMIQGYYFYKPMPEEEFAKLLDK